MLSAAKNNAFRTVSLMCRCFSTGSTIMTFMQQREKHECASCTVDGSAFFRNTSVDSPIQDKAFTNSHKNIEQLRSAYDVKFQSYRNKQLGKNPLSTTMNEIYSRRQNADGEWNSKKEMQYSGIQRFGKDLKNKRPNADRRLCYQRDEKAYAVKIRSFRRQSNDRFHATITEMFNRMPKDETPVDVYGQIIINEQKEETPIGKQNKTEISEIEHKQHKQPKSKLKCPFQLISSNTFSVRRNSENQLVSKHQANRRRYSWNEPTIKFSKMYNEKKPYTVAVQKFIQEPEQQFSFYSTPNLEIDRNRTDEEPVDVYGQAITKGEEPEEQIQPYTAKKRFSGEIKQVTPVNSLRKFYKSQKPYSVYIKKCYQVQKYPFYNMSKEAFHGNQKLEKPVDVYGQNVSGEDESNEKDSLDHKQKVGSQADMGALFKQISNNKDSEDKDSEDIDETKEKMIAMMKDFNWNNEMGGNPSHISGKNQNNKTVHENQSEENFEEVGDINEDNDSIHNINNPQVIGEKSEAQREDTRKLPHH